MTSEPCFISATFDILHGQDPISKTGRCCCNCKYNHKIFAHPWNEDEFAKGPITKQIGYVCWPPEFPMIFFDMEHSLCEMHDWKSDK